MGPWATDRGVLGFTLILLDLCAVALAKDFFVGSVLGFNVPSAAKVFVAGFRSWPVFETVWPAGGIVC